MTSQRKRRRPTWFDIPPIEVIIRIATFLSAREHTSSTLAFAQLSHHTSRAVAAALDYRLVIDTTTLVQATAWQLVFADSLRHLTISAALPFNQQFVPLLRSPCIQTLSIPSHPEYLQAIATSPTLRILSVTFVESVLSAPGLPHFINILPTLRITTLRLLSEGSYVPTLFQNLFTVFHSDPPLLNLGKSCPYVESLHIGVKLWSMRQLLPVLQRFPKLRNLSLSGIINVCDRTDQHLIRFLRQLDTVQLFGIGDGPSLAAQMSGCITGLKHGPTLLCGLEALSICTKLKVLHVEIQHGHETVLPQLAKRLQSLRIRWQYRCQGGFYSPEPGMLLDVVQKAPELRDLHLMDVEVTLVEASLMMKEMGSRLTSFGFPLTSQRQTAVKTLTRLATVGARWNPELEELCPLAREEIFSARHWGWRTQIISVEEKEGLMTALKRLHQHAPLFKAGVLERLGVILTMDVGRCRNVSSQEIRSVEF